LDSTIADCGKLYPSAVGVWIGQSSHNVIVHNDIHDLYYTGISIGWTWGYGPSAAGDNLVELNDIHDIGAPHGSGGPILSDMGGIYTLGKQPGTVIRNNRFHDIAALRYGGWGIYFDEGSSYILAENNLVYNTTHGGLHQHYGQDNVVKNNIFAFGRDTQIQRSREEDHQSFSFTHNIVYWDSGSLLAGKWPGHVMLDDNIYWQVSGSDIRFAGKSWDEWRKSGLDAHSRIADPMFADPKQGNFEIKADPKIFGSLFVPFDVSSAGPRARKL
ncbi:MAG TPA: right-handed parallel beta-helix repeat-containing protein, partial [Humisphaera sp.]|nr:right-handed parallel beta-helix repeat-containing protein [Humisphaera sp.]